MCGSILEILSKSSNSISSICNYIITTDSLLILAFSFVMLPVNISGELPSYDKATAIPANKPPSYFEAVAGIDLNSINGTLSFVDFLPTSENSKCRDQVDRCNSWLSEHPDMEAKSLETLVFRWRNELDVQCMTYESASSNCALGIRMWVNSRIQRQPHQVLGYECIVPQMNKNSEFENLEQLIHRLNDMISNSHFPGWILTVQTCSVRLSNWSDFDPDRTLWSERFDDTDVDQKFVKVLRVFYVVGVPAFEVIDHVDFIPSTVDSSFGGHRCFEQYSDCYSQASVYASRHLRDNVRLVCIETVLQQFKRKYGSVAMKTMDSTSTERGRKAVYFCLIIRMWTARSLIPYPVPLTAPRLSCVTVVPEQKFKHKKSFSEFPSPLEYQHLDEVKLGLLQWLQMSKVRVLSAETVAVRMYDFEVQSYSWQQKTVVSKHPAKNECWIFMLRIHCDGVIPENVENSLSFLSSFNGESESEFQDVQSSSSKSACVIA